ncbi:GAF domain-containing protein [Chloroflexota bacterium]
MTSEENHNQSIREDAQQLSRRLHKLQGILRSQREILRQRGMSLPPGVLTILEDVQINIEAMIKALKKEEEELHQLRTLIKTTDMINSTLDLDSVLNQAMDTVIQLTEAERGYLMLRDEQTGAMEYRVARNLELEQLENQDFMISKSVINQVAQDGEPVVTTNAQSDPRFADQASIVSFNLRSILCVPLKIKDRVTGVIYADNRIRAGLFGDGELALLFAFANQAAVAIENAQLFERIRTTLVEITEIKELMDDVFASIPSGVIVTNHENRVINHNQSAEDILNLQPDQSIGEAIDKLLPYLAEGLLRILATVRAENRRATVELTAQVGNRGPRNLNFKMSPLRDPEKDDIEGVALVLDDLTDLRQDEAQLNVVRRYLPPEMVDNIKSIAQLGLGGMRREITILYADVRPMDTFPPDLTPQQQMAGLNQYMAVASGPIHRYGGIIDKYMGTEVMALFNTQLNASDHHQWDAIQAALAMVDDFMALYAEHGEPESTVYYRIGIHSGIATMGNVGSNTRREFTAIGDTVNLAHRLVDMAGRGEVLISEDIYTACQGKLSATEQTINMADRGEIQIRGRIKPVRIFQLRQRG